MVHSTFGWAAHIPIPVHLPIYSSMVRMYTAPVLPHPAALMCGMLLTTFTIKLTEMSESVMVMRRGWTCLVWQAVLQQLDQPAGLGLTLCWWLCLA